MKSSPIASACRPSGPSVRDQIIAIARAASHAVSSLTSPYYRNATGDECVYVERGTATVETVFGALEVRN